MAKLTILFCLCSTVLLSQNLVGTLYDAEAPVSGVKIMNITSRAITNSDDRGHFEIYAKYNDTVIFSSLFYHTKQVVISKSNLATPQVFELRQVLNQLAEVTIEDPSFPQATSAKEATKKINQQFKTDVAKNPHVYRRPNTNSGPIDFLEIGRRVARLFKRKTPQAHQATEKRITANDLDALFKTSPFFNNKFLILNLNITKDYKHLFFAYCETHDMSLSLLSEEIHIYFIARLLEYSKGFQEILKGRQAH